MNLGAPELLILVLVALVGLVPLGLVIWAIVDASSRPDWVWERAGQNRVTWVVMPAVGLFLCGIVGLVLAVVYLVSIRPQLENVQQTGPY